MRSRVRSRPLNAQHTRYADARSVPGWREARSVLGHVASLLFWLFLGVVNAYFTVVALAALGTILSEAGQANPSTVTPMISGPASTAGSLLLYGPFTWTLALVSAVVEGATWRNIRSRGGFTFLLVLLADIATTVWGLLGPHRGARLCHRWPCSARCVARRACACRLARADARAAHARP
jgi:hypothetical protein